MRVDLHPEARAEFRAAALWYEERHFGLGDEFVAAIGVALQRIGEATASFPRWPGTRPAPTMIRKSTIERFPYVIAFEQYADYALVLSIAHQKRRPLYWLGRASGIPG